MNFYKCDACGRNLKKEELRYRVKIEVSAIYEQNEIHLADLIRNHQQEILQLLKRMEEMSADELEEQIYKSFEFDLCPTCHREYIKSPLHLTARSPLKDDEQNTYKITERFLHSLVFEQEKKD
ncbi:MAG TPA: hypothetical protein PLA12_10205 [Candidatus Hydrogenedens sp.]|nr:hypothetical protein [Candidatus Hydrogenedens sp.]